MNGMQLSLILTNRICANQNSLPINSSVKAKLLFDVRHGCQELLLHPRTLRAVICK